MKHANWFYSMMTVLSIFSTTAAMAEVRSLPLRFHDRQFSGHHVINLAAVLRDQYPDVDPARWSLEGVRLVAKTRRGEGTAQLWVNFEGSYDKVVGGNPRDFNSTDSRTFHTVDFRSPRGSGTTPWEMELRGDFKVREMIVYGRRR